MKRSLIVDSLLSRGPDVTLNQIEPNNVAEYFATGGGGGGKKSGGVSPASVCIPPMHPSSIPVFLDSFVSFQAAAASDHLVPTAKPKKSDRSERQLFRGVYAPSGRQSSGVEGVSGRRQGKSPSTKAQQLLIDQVAHSVLRGRQRSASAGS